LCGNRAIEVPALVFSEQTVRNFVKPTVIRHTPAGVRYAPLYLDRRFASTAPNLDNLSIPVPKFFLYPSRAPAWPCPDMQR